MDIATFRQELYQYGLGERNFKKDEQGTYEIVVNGEALCVVSLSMIEESLDCLQVLQSVQDQIEASIPLLSDYTRSLLLASEVLHDLECVCGNTLAWLIEFFGPAYQQEHIQDCEECGQHTLHVSDEAERCVNPACGYRAGVDAEGNVYERGKIVSNGGKSVDQLRDEYFYGESFIID